MIKYLCHYERENQLALEIHKKMSQLEGSNSKHRAALFLQKLAVVFRVNSDKSEICQVYTLITCELYVLLNSMNSNFDLFAHI